MVLRGLGLWRWVGLIVGILLVSSSGEVSSTFSSSSLSLSSTSRVSSNPLCQSEVSRICRRGRTTQDLPDLDALECILNQKRNEVEELTEECNHVLWEFRKEITQPEGFKQLGADCLDEFVKTGCSNKSVELSPGFNYVSCIIDHKDQVENQKCQSFITRLEGLIFADYEVIGRFAERCKDDITKFVCGRNDAVHETQIQRLPNSQGKTIECLSKHIRNLQDQCTVEILRVAELQVDDFHLDRALYFACRDDREKFCSRVQAGNGRVYKCLLRHKVEPEMSDDCRDQVYRRQQLGWQDYKASGVATSCKNEIKKFKCRRGVSSSDKIVRLSQILLCLENEMHKGQEINGDCLDELKLHRKSLMEDHSVTPELLAACTEDKQRYCQNKGIHGKTLHCLMAHAASRKERLRPQCIVELENILKISDISNDWTVDPVLKQSCSKVVDRSVCSTYPHDKMLDCLMNILTTDSGGEGSVMTNECETTLIQIQYFMAREFTMDSSLYEVCRNDAKSICKAKSDWSDNPQNMDPARGSYVLSCLFRNIVPDDPRKMSTPVSPECANKVKEIMRQRALSVKLMPEIEEPCMDDLSVFCSQKTKSGEELQCLQDHLEELNDKKCQEAVGAYTQIEMKNPTVDPFIWKYCRDVIENKCSEDKSDDEDLLDCLAEQKHDIKSKKCKVSIEHFQLIKLKDVKRFSPKFKSNCESDVIRYCSSKDQQLTSNKIISCLSEIIRKDIVTENTQRISKGCRKQVRYLLAAKVQLESTGVDGMYKICSNAISRHCADVPRGGGHILECLRKNEQAIHDTDRDCHKSLFETEAQVEFDSKMDVVLNSECEAEIKMFCFGKQDSLLQCLRRNSDKEGFDKIRCGRIVRDRLLEQSRDLRLNPRLQKACRLDVESFCPNIAPGQGRIIGCLKNVFLNAKIRLSRTCTDYIKEMMERAAKDDVRFDNDLYTTCKFDIDKSCKHQLVDSEDKNESDDGDTEECLKGLYRTDKISEQKCKAKVAQLIQASMIDIHTDPILNQACAIDLVRHCEDVPPGDGRLLNCLLAKLHDEQGKKGFHLSERCHNLLQTRTDLYQKAGAPGRMESLQDLIDQVQISPHRNYFLSFAMTVVGMIFIFGLLCGRVTKRRAAAKNK